MRHAFRTEKDLLDERPRVKTKRERRRERKEGAKREEGEEEDDDEILPITCQEVQGQSGAEGGKEQADLDTSLITDFQLITDLRVSPY